MASLTGAMNGSPPELGPMARVISEAEAFRQMSPVDRLKLTMPSNWAPVGEEQAGQNRQQNLRDLLSVVPGPGNVIAAEDATQSFGDAADYAQQGRYGRAALMGGLGLLSGFGAVTGLPTGRMAGAAARGAKDSVNIFAGPMAKTADHAKLTQAELMKHAGFPREKIWESTGWFQGNDGKWRFEIDDSGAALAGVKPPQSPNHASTFNDVSHPQYEAAYGSFEPHEQPFGSYLPKEISGTFDPRATHQGQYYPVSQSIYAQGNSEQDALGVALHEMQHHTQGLEDFARGGQPAAFARELPSGGYDNGYDIYARLAGEVEARNVQTRMNMTAAERRAKAPWLTQDVPDEQQIVRKR